MSFHTIDTIRLANFETTVLRCDTADVFTSCISDDTPDLVVCDTNTAGIPLPFPATTPRVVVPAGEAAKTDSVYLALLESFVSRGLTRESVVFAVGGGALTDVVAFAASTYLRGVSVILVPTTLLSMVDAAIGGKTGIDFGGYKNMVGTFYPAAQVRIVPATLGTLPQREYMSGLAEVIKAALLDDAELLDLLERSVAAVIDRDDTVVDTMIARAIAVKCRIVERDFTESGVRAFLNLGHTFGHALESVLGLGAWTHGEAVAWGIARAMHAGREVGITDGEWKDRVLSLLERYGYETDPAPVEPEQLVGAMYKDKKRTRDGIRFVLQTGPQATTLRSLVPAEIIDILKR